MRESFEGIDKDHEMMMEILNQNEKREKEKIEGKMEISNEEFQKILLSERFLEAIRIAAEETKERGVETGFDINIFEDKSSIISGVRRGSNESMTSYYGEDKFIEGGPLNDEDKEKKRATFNFHFHPMEKVAIVPSEEDITYLSRHEKSIDSVIGICQIEDGKINILLIKPKMGVHIGKIPDLAEEYDEKIEREFGNTDWLNPKYQKNILDALNSVGFDVAFISLEERNGTSVLTDESKEELLKMGKVNLRFTR